MKTKLIIFIWMLIVNNGFSQDWNPFVLNQNSYYKQQYDNSAKVENFLLDSILNIEDAEILYFNAKSELKPDCYKNIKAAFEYMDWFKNPNKIDSLVKKNDSILFIANYPSDLDTFIFKPYAKLDNSWITNGITITCTRIEVSDILNNQDSIKTYTCSGNGYDGIEFVLSKNYGFLKFLPLNEFLYHSSSSDFPPYFELIGYSNGISSFGYTHPDFSDYFHLGTGDMLYWRDYSNPDDITQPRSTTYHVDSITTVYISSDSVYYGYKRTDYNENGAVTHVGNYSTYHLRKDEGKIVQINTSWFGLKYNRYQPYEIFFLESLYFKIENNDTITYTQYHLPGLTIDTSDCMVGFIADYDLTVGFSTREGKIFQGTYSWGESSTTLIGSIINGIKYNETDIPTGIDKITFDNIKVYPNPFHDYINIKSPDGVSLLEIFDATGSLILKSEIDNEIIDLGKLTTGIYIMKITDSKDKTRQLKLLKQ
jgi:hypothetical protein